MLYWLVTTVVVTVNWMVLSNGEYLQDDIEWTAIKEATQTVDDYFNWISTDGRMKTIAGNVINGKRPHHPYTLLYLFSRYMWSPRNPDEIARSARIAVAATERILARGKIPNPITFAEKMKPVCSVPKIKCDPTECYRNIDGACNNLNYPLWGKTLTAQTRFLPPSFDDKFNLGFAPRMFSKVGGPLPNPRDISNIFHASGTCPLEMNPYNVLLTTFGQCVAHDVTANPAIGGFPNIECCKGDEFIKRPECNSIPTPLGEFQTKCMNFVRSQIAPIKNCLPGPMMFMNQVTSFIDLSPLYGSDPKTANKLVDPLTGKMITGFGQGLPKPGRPSECVGDAPCFATGDTRSTIVPTSTTFYTAFLREHNRIVEILCEINPHWKGPRLYQEAKKIVIGIYQHIAFSEYLPIILGRKTMTFFGITPRKKGFNTKYDELIDPSTRDEFAAASFRFGHSQIGKKIGSANKDRSIRAFTPLDHEFFNTRTIHNKNDFGVDGIGRWMTTASNENPDKCFADSVRNQLFATKPNNGFDLAAFDIHRGRDHGLRSYNEYRRLCGLIPYTVLPFKDSYTAFPDHDPATADLLLSIYKHPEDIDLITGGLSERPMKGALVGPTFGCLIGLQFKYYRNGDRFFYENKFPETGFTEDQLNIIKQQTMSSVLCRSFRMGFMQPNAFVAAPMDKRFIPCEEFPNLGPYELSAWRSKY